MLLPGPELLCSCWASWHVRWYMFSFLVHVRDLNVSITFWTAETLNTSWYLEQIPLRISQWVLALSICQVWSKSGHFDGGYNMEHGSDTLCRCLELLLFLHTACTYSGFSPLHKYMVSWTSCCCCLNENRWLSSFIEIKVLATCSLLSEICTVFKL